MPNRIIPSNNIIVAQTEMSRNAKLMISGRIFGGLLPAQIRIICSDILSVLDVGSSILPTELAWAHPFWDINTIVHQTSNLDTWKD